MPDKKPIDASILDRVVQGVRYMITGSKPNEWFGPGQPIAPQAQDKDGTVGRRFDFPVTANIRRQPRDGEGVSFEHLRNFADGYDLLRLVIETRKDQMSKMRWKFGPDVSAGAVTAAGLTTSTEVAPMTPNFTLAKSVRSTAARLGIVNDLPEALIPAVLATLAERIAAFSA